MKDKIILKMKQIYICPPISITPHLPPHNEQTAKEKETSRYIFQGPTSWELPGF